MLAPLVGRQPSALGRTASWTVQILLALAFLASGGAKLAGAVASVEIFDQIGIGQWFRYVTAIVEIVGAGALLWPGLAPLGAALLGVTMSAAMLLHLFVLDSSAAAAGVLLLLCVLVLGLRRREIPALLAPFPSNMRAEGAPP